MHSSLRRASSLAHTCAFYSAELLLTQRLPHQQRVFVRLTEGQAVQRMPVGAQGVDGGTAVVDDAVQEAEFGGRAAHVAHADVDADFRQALLPPDVTQFGLQLLGGGLCVAARGQTAESHLNVESFKCKERAPQIHKYIITI